MITGTISYDNHNIIPRDSKLVIQLRDVSYADGGSLLIAEKIIDGVDLTPIKFKLDYAADQIEKRNIYSVQVSVYNPNGQLVYVSDTSHNVITRDHPRHVEIMLLSVPLDDLEPPPIILPDESTNSETINF